MELCCLVETFQQVGGTKYLLVDKEQLEFKARIKCTTTKRNLCSKRIHIVSQDEAKLVSPQSLVAHKLRPHLMQPYQLVLSQRLALPSSMD